MKSVVDGSRPRLVALDDEPLSADLIVRVAGKCGYEARAMVETSTLVGVLMTWEPQVLTLDMRMPRVSGSDVISMLKIIKFPGHLIIVSGLGPSFLDEARQRAEFGGLKLAAVMRKPIDLQALRDVLGTLRADRAASPGVRAS